MQAVQFVAEAHNSVNDRGISDLVKTNTKVNRSFLAF